MSSGQGCVDAIADGRILAILRYPGPGDLLGALRALHDGGIQATEITLDTPGALDAIEAWRGQGGCVGAGTVLSASAVRDVAAAGGTFVVSPGFIAEVVTAAQTAGIVSIPGVLTPTELIAARSAGARLLKLFPAGPLGVGYLRALRAPFSDTQLVPTGGIDASNAVDFLNAGATALAVGSALAGRQAPNGLEDLAEIRDRARTWAALVHPDAEGDGIARTDTTRGPL